MEKFEEKMSQEQSQAMLEELEAYKKELEEKIEAVARQLESGQSEDMIDRLHVELNDLREQKEGIEEAIKNQKKNNHV